MTDSRTTADGVPDDATAIEGIIPPEQPPMDDAAGPGTDDSTDIDDTATDDLSVQGGE